MDGMLRAMGAQMIQKMKLCELAKDIEFKRFEARIWEEQATINRSKKEIQKDWDTKKQREN